MGTDIEYDVVVIGAGAAGENAADIAQRNGLESVIVEHELVGGACSYWACMPSKALLHSGQMLDTARRTPGVAGAELDVDAALEHRNSVAAHWEDDGQVDWLESAGIDLVRGHGRINGALTVEVEHQDGSSTTIRARRAVVIATGSAPAAPPIDGLDEIEYWDNRDITSSKEVPRRLIVLGGGPVGVEMAQAWKMLGTEQVTIVEREERLLVGREPFVGEEMAERFEELGIEVRVGAEMTAVSREASGGAIRATVDDGDEQIEITGDELLVAVGRRARTRDLGLETIDLEPGEIIEVDDRLCATAADGWLYAVGDVNGRAPLTHAGKYQARIAGLAIAGNEETNAWGDRRALPQVIFTTPRIAAVGLTEREAREEGFDVRTVTSDTGATAGAVAQGAGFGGTAKLVIDARARTLLGATFVGPDTGEMLHAATVAIAGGVPIDALWHAIPSFPTVSEVWLRLLEAYRDEYDHTFV